MTDTPTAPARSDAPRGRRLWLCAAALVVGLLVAFLNPDESALRALRLKFRPHPPSGQVAILDVDDRSVEAIGKWPIPRGLYGEALDRLFALGAKRVFFTFDFSSRQDPVQDARFARAIARHRGRVFLPSRVVVDTNGNARNAYPIPSLARSPTTVSSSFRIANGSGRVTTLPYSVNVDGRNFQGLAAFAAGRIGGGNREFGLDPAVDLSKVDSILFKDLLAGNIARSKIFGKSILVGSSSAQVQGFFFVPPYGPISTSAIHLLGIETLSQGRPIDLGGVPAVLFVVVLVAIAEFVWQKCAIYLQIAMMVVLPFAPLLLPNIVSLEVVPAVAAIVTMLLVNIWAVAQAALRKRERVNYLSGFSNLAALRLHQDEPSKRLVVAHVQNFSEVIATLPPEAESALIEQIAARLDFAVERADLFHGDNGVFAWFASDELDGLIERLDGLHALFRSPVTVADTNVDLSVTFGVDDDGTRSVANRLGSALVAATEAAVEGTRYRVFDKSKLADAAWKLSLLSQLDAAIDDGHLWVAYQPKLDLATDRLIGAEALVRWTHPEKGAISPIEFVAAAEQNNRIERLTAHVLERAILAAATINAHDIPFGIAVNLSARLLENRDIVSVVAAALAANRLDPAHLTLEITETATITGGEGLIVLKELRDLGLRISIDDYGTGMSTLDYLKKIPASEIKVDKGFVQAMMTSTSDLLMVNSTIQLAHSLGHVVVAEGVESDDVIARLREMGCDIAQGYRIGRPMTFQDLARRLLAERRKAA